jgi:histidinol-phosphate aminotransferase
MPDVAHLMRPDIANLEAYTPIVPPDILATQLGIPIDDLIKLDANENPYGPLPAVRQALADKTSYAIYPDPDHTHLRQALSHYTQQPVERIICGAGADELIDLLLRLFLQPGDRVIDCPPTFGMYAFDTLVCAGQVVAVPRREDFALDVPAIERAVAETHAKVVFITTPNNPTGNITPPEEIARLAQLPVLVVVDEAYIEFTRTPHGSSSLVGKYENVVVLRTFSKWAGLAGLRVGYALLHEQLAPHLWKIKQPYNVNVAALVAAQTALEHREDVLDNVARIVCERERVLLALARIPFLSAYPSQANFLLCRVVNADALAVKNHLAQRGILVRYYQKPGLRDCIRISIGTPDQMNRVIELLEDMSNIFT